MIDKRYKKWDIVWVNLEPVKGREIKKTRPCLIISPDVINKLLNIVTIAPLTSTIRKFPMRVEIIHDKKSSEVCIEQIRTIDKERIVSKDKQSLKESYHDAITDCIHEYFKK